MFARGAMLLHGILRCLGGAKNAIAVPQQDWAHSASTISLRSHFGRKNAGWSSQFRLVRHVEVRVVYETA